MGLVILGIRRSHLKSQKPDKRGICKEQFLQRQLKQPIVRERWWRLRKSIVKKHRHLFNVHTQINKDKLEVERGWTSAMLLSMTRAMILDTADSNGCMCPKFGGQNDGTEMAAHLTGKTMKSGALCYRANSRSLVDTDWL